MSNAARAIGASGISEMPKHERPLSELFRIAAKEWVELDGAASTLEELKTTKLEQDKQALIEREGDMPDNRAERIVKASADWEQYIRDMVKARTAANLARVKVQWIEKRFSEWQSADANARKERSMSR